MDGANRKLTAEDLKLRETMYTKRRTPKPKGPSAGEFDKTLVQNKTQPKATGKQGNNGTLAKKPIKSLRKRRDKAKGKKNTKRELATSTEYNPQDSVITRKSAKGADENKKTLSQRVLEHPIIATSFGLIVVTLATFGIVNKDAIIQHFNGSPEELIEAQEIVNNVIGEVKEEVKAEEKQKFDFDDGIDWSNNEVPDDLSEFDEVKVTPPSKEPPKESANQCITSAGKQFIKRYQTYRHFGKNGISTKKRSAEKVINSYFSPKTIDKKANSAAKQKKRLDKVKEQGPSSIQTPAQFKQACQRQKLFVDETSSELVKFMLIVDAHKDSKDRKMAPVFHAQNKDTQLTLISTGLDKFPKRAAIIKFGDHHEVLTNVRKNQDGSTSIGTQRKPNQITISSNGEISTGITGLDEFQGSFIEQR